MTKTHGILHYGLRALLVLLLLGALAFGGVLAMVCWKETHIPAAADYDAIIVLGAQVLPEGTPSVQLAWRLDKAVEIWKERPVPVVCCGAQGVKEPMAEALVMRDYLIAQGVEAAQILTDPDSYNTRQNLQNAIRLLTPYDTDTVLIVTSDYHLPRALALAEDEGLRATGVGSPTKPEYWAKNHLRETLAWIKYWAEKYHLLPLRGMQDD